MGCGGVVALKVALMGALSSLERLALDDNDIGATGGMALGECLPLLTSLRELSLRRNPFGTTGGLALLTGFCSDSSPPASCTDAPEGLTFHASHAPAAHQDLCEEDRAQSFALTPDGSDASLNAAALAAAARFREMRVLDVSQCNFQGAATEKTLAAALRQMPGLQDLALQGNLLGGSGGGVCVNLCDSLYQLSVSHDLAQRNMSSFTSSSAGLVNLKLGGVGLGWSGAEALAKPLAQFTHLLHLGLGRNGLGDAGLLKLMDALSQLRLLRTLGLQHNDLGPACSARIAELILSLHMLQDVRLYGNNLHLGANGIRPLAACRNIITWDTDI
jgi:Ran GTPase-activating protein (RanGAP) involved in mRNA processing and transport